MSTLASLLIAVGWIWLLVRAFQSSFWWGVGCLVLPLVWLLFALLHPREAAPPFAVFVAGMVLLILSR
jgi:hypothetical protein